MLLELKDVRAFYGKIQVLQGVSFAARAGEVTCLLGRNGVGKTTTLRSIIGLVPPREGSILFRDKPLTGMPTHSVIRNGIEYVPEERRIFPTLSVEENLQMGAKQNAGNRGSAWTVVRVLDYFPNLKERATSKGRVLSGGEQQMLAIGRALVGNPTLLLVDEPTEGLAPVIVRQVKSVIRDIATQGISVLLVESKLAVAQELANQIHVMSKGQIVFSGTPGELEHRPDVRQTYLEV